MEDRELKRLKIDVNEMIRKREEIEEETEKLENEYVKKRRILAEINEEFEDVCQRKVSTERAQKHTLNLEAQITTIDHEISVLKERTMNDRRKVEMLQAESDEEKIIVYELEKAIQELERQITVKGKENYETVMEIDRIINEYNRLLYASNNNAMNLESLKEQEFNFQSLNRGVI